MTGHAKLVLVVDDDQDIRESLRDVLEDQGYVVATAANGADALEQLRGGLRPAIVLLDLMMPVMDGWTFRQHQLADPDLAHIPVILVTASGHCENDAVRLAVTGCIRKPVSLTKLLDLVEHEATA